MSTPMLHILVSYALPYDETHSAGLQFYNWKRTSCLALAFAHPCTCNSLLYMPFFYFIRAADVYSGESYRSEAPLIVPFHYLPSHEYYEALVNSKYTQTYT